MKIIERLMELNRFEDYKIDFYQKVISEEIREFELKHTIQLPNSYKSFIQEYGFFTIRRKSDWYRLLSLEEAIDVKRNHFSDNIDTIPDQFPEVDRLTNLFVFQNNGWGNTRFFTFDLASKTENSVLSIDLEDKIYWNQPKVSFEEHIERLVTAILNEENTFFFSQKNI